jgi:hypothetical protein
MRAYSNHMCSIDRSDCRRQIWLLWLWLLQMLSGIVSATDAHVLLPASFCEGGCS